MVGFFLSLFLLFQCLCKVSYRIHISLLAWTKRNFPTIFFGLLFPKWSYIFFESASNSRSNIIDIIQEERTSINMLCGSHTVVARRDAMTNWSECDFFPYKLNTLGAAGRQTFLGRKLFQHHFFITISRIRIGKMNILQL